jgi:hypothetical protein
MPAKPLSRREPFLILAGVITASSLFFCIVFAGAGHGTYVPCVIFFPFSMLLAIRYGEIGAISFLLALAQFFVYAFILDWKRRAAWLLVILHIAALAWGIRSLPGSNFG